METPKIVAHSAWGFGCKIVPSFTKREWMREGGRGHAYHCLPMVVANQSGWMILAMHALTAEWDGGYDPKCLNIQSDAPHPWHANSAVGNGIISWTIPYVFRTSPGWNLLCRGPANWPKDGVAPLEGMIETDWACQSFSANWKMTRPGRVEFAKDEPIAMIVPYRRGDIESFTCELDELKNNEKLNRGYDAWMRGQMEHREKAARGCPVGYQKTYLTGVCPVTHAEPFPDHQKGRGACEFKRIECPAK